MSTVLVQERLEEEEAQREVPEEELQRRPSSPNAVEETELGHSKIEPLRINEAKVLEEQREREVLLLVLELEQEQLLKLKRVLDHEASGTC